MSMHDLPYEALFQFDKMPERYQDEVETDGEFYFLTFCDDEGDNEGYLWCLQHAVCWTSLDEDDDEF